MSAMSGGAFTLAVLYDTQRDPEPLSRARAALAALGEDNDHARLARAGAVVTELEGLMEGR